MKIKFYQEHKNNNKWRFFLCDTYYFYVWETLKQLTRNHLIFFIIINRLTMSFLSLADKDCLNERK